jgi:hypothetical protein
MRIEIFITALQKLSKPDRVTKVDMSILQALARRYSLYNKTLPNTHMVPCSQLAFTSKLDYY